MARSMREGNVPNKPIREAFLRSGLSTYDVALFCDWLKGKAKHPDTSKVERMLGLREYKSHGRIIKNSSMAEHNALKVVEAIGLDPVDFREIGL